MTDQNSKKTSLEQFFQGLESWVNAPSQADPDLQRKGRIIHTLTFLSLVLGFATLSITPFIFTDPVRDVSITIGAMLMILIVQILNRRGKTLPAAHLFVIGSLIFVSGMTLFSGGFQSKFQSVFITITVMGGLILGEMYAFHIGGVSIIAFLIFYFIDSKGWTPAPLIVFTPIAMILLNIISIFLAATVLIMVIVKYEEYFKKLVIKEQTLQKTNLSLTQEIQAREEAESHLQQSETQLKSALMESPFPTMLHAGHGDILLINTAWTDSSGYSLETVSDFNNLLNGMFRENKPQIDEKMNQLLSGASSRDEGIFTLYTKNGEPLKWFLRWTRLPTLKDDSTLLLTIATDMTNLLDTESALRESEENLSKFTLVTNDGLWDWDLTTDKVHFDPRYYTMAGYEVNDFPHELEEFRKRVHPEDVERVFSHAEQHLRGEIDRFNVEFRYLQKDASWKWIMGRGRITEQDANGSPLRFVGTHTDISAQKEIEEKLSDYQLQLEDVVEDRTLMLNERIMEVERLNAALINILDDYQITNERLSLLGNDLSAANQELESLTYSLSTDLMKPILEIKDAAAKIITKSPDKLTPKELVSYNAILDNAALVDRQIHDLLIITQLSKYEITPEDFDAKKLVKKVLNSFSKEINKYHIKTTIKDLPYCLGDRDLIEKVFESLVNNAIKFSKDQHSPEIIISYQPELNSERGAFFIQDNGIGFKSEDLTRIFEPASRLDAEDGHSTTGIGLRLAKLIIHKHSGKIWAESKEGKGTTFFFDLPISPKEG